MSYKLPCVVQLRFEMRSKSLTLSVVSFFFHSWCGGSASKNRLAPKRTGHITHAPRRFFTEPLLYAQICHKRKFIRSWQESSFPDTFSGIFNVAIRPLVADLVTFEMLPRNLRLIHRNVTFPTSKDRWRLKHQNFPALIETAPHGVPASL